MNKHLCHTCQEAEPFAGWDDCLACGVATMLVEDPEYISFANRVFRDDVEWLRDLNAEWTRQAGALAVSGPVPNLRVRQAS